jgi:hypothetical protein
MKTGHFEYKAGQYARTHIYSLSLSLSIVAPRCISHGKSAADLWEHAFSSMCNPMPPLERLVCEAMPPRGRGS